MTPNRVAERRSRGSGVSYPDRMTQRGDTATPRALGAAAWALTAVALAAGCGDDSNDTDDGGVGSPAEVMAEGRPTDEVLEDVRSAGWVVGVARRDCEDGSEMVHYNWSDPSGERIEGWGVTGDVWHEGEPTTDDILACTAPERVGDSASGSVDVIRPDGEGSDP